MTTALFREAGQDVGEERNYPDHVPQRGVVPEPVAQEPCLGHRI